MHLRWHDAKRVERRSCGAAAQEWAALRQGLLGILERNLQISIKSNPNPLETARQNQTNHTLLFDHVKREKIHGQRSCFAPSSRSERQQHRAHPSLRPDSFLKCLRNPRLPDFSLNVALQLACAADKKGGLKAAVLPSRRLPLPKPTQALLQSPTRLNPNPACSPFHPGILATWQPSKQTVSSPLEHRPIRRLSHRQCF